MERTTPSPDDRSDDTEYTPPRVEVLGSLSQLTFGVVTAAQMDNGMFFLPSAAIMP